MKVHGAPAVFRVCSVARRTKKDGGKTRKRPFFPEEEGGWFKLFAPILDAKAEWTGRFCASASWYVAVAVALELSVVVAEWFRQRCSTCVIWFTSFP